MAAPRRGCWFHLRIFLEGGSNPSLLGSADPHTISSAPALEFSKPRRRHRSMGFGAEHLGYFACTGEVGGSQLSAHQNSSSDIGTFCSRRRAVQPELPATAFGRDEEWYPPRSGPFEFLESLRKVILLRPLRHPVFSGTCVAREAGRAPAGSPGKIFSPLFTLKTLCIFKCLSLNKTHRYSPSVPSHSITFIYRRPVCTVVHSYVPQ